MLCICLQRQRSSLILLAISALSPEHIRHCVVLFFLSNHWCNQYMAYHQHTLICRRSTYRFLVSCYEQRLSPSSRLCLFKRIRLRGIFSGLRPPKSATADEGGGGEIRTHGTLSGTAVFKTATLNHSVTPPDIPFKRVARKKRSVKHAILKTEERILSPFPRLWHHHHLRPRNNPVCSGPRRRLTPLPDIRKRRSF